VGKNGERELALEDPIATTASSTLPNSATRSSPRFAFRAAGTRRTGASAARLDRLPVLGVAVAIASRTVSSKRRVVLGAVASRPLLVPESQSLAGRQLTDDVIEEFAERAAARQTASTTPTSP
jgi:hypothetical protein